MSFPFQCSWQAALLLAAAAAVTITRLPRNEAFTIKRPGLRRHAQIPLPSQLRRPEEDGDASPKTLQDRCDAVRHTLRQLATWSLQDYKWRRDVFRANQADRLVEQSMASLTGTKAAYVRPMDADESTRGPLGRWEAATVDWLLQVFDEEGRRARQIIAADGKLIRPLEAAAAATVNATNEVSLGPLGKLEAAWVDWIESVTRSEQVRASTKTRRPMELDTNSRGPLGNMEAAAVSFWNALRDSEQLRYRLAQQRRNQMVRPIDVPGPLGEWELAVSEIFTAEKYRARRQRQSNDGRLVRPKDVSIPGPLGQAEWTVSETLQQLSAEEMERWRNIQQFLRDNRPMENDRASPLGLIETVVVGILRSPLLLWNVLARVRELLSSAPLREIGPMQRQTDQPRRRTGTDKSYFDDDGFE